MKNTHSLLIAIGCSLIPSSIQAAITWDNITFTSLGNSTLTNDNVNTAPWTGRGAQESLLNDASGTITGFFTATDSLGQPANSTLSNTSIINFSFTIFGGTADLNFTDSTANGGGTEWYRMIFEDISSDVTSIDYSFEYAEAVTAISRDFTLVGARANTDVDSVLTYSVQDENLQAIDLTDPDSIWVTTRKSDADFFDPNDSANASTSGSVATLNIGANDGLDGLGYSAADNTFSSDDEVAGVFGSLTTANAGESFGEDSILQFTFNGNFTGTEVVPEPSSIALLGIGLSAFILRRNRH